MTAAIRAGRAAISDDGAELWRVIKGDRAILCRRREVRSEIGDNRDNYIALELRVEHDGEIYVSEVHEDRVEFQRRVEELRAALEAEGWIASINAGNDASK